MTIEELRSRLAAIEEERRQIDQAAGDAALDDAQQTRWEALDTDEADVRRQIGEIEEREARAQRVRDSRAQWGATRMGDPDPLAEPHGLTEPRRANPWDLDAVTRSLHRESPERGGADLRARALGAVEHVQGVSARSKEHLTTLLEQFDYEDDDLVGAGARQVAAHVIAVSSREYMRAWGKALRSGLRTGQPDVDALKVLQRAASLTDAAGGYAVPLPIDPTLIVNDDGSVSPLRQISTVRTATTDQYRLINATAVSASYDAEGSEVSDDTPTWDKDDITLHMARAFVPYSIEIGMDYPGFTQDVAMLLANAKTNLENTKFVLGSGTNEPIGVVTALTGTSSIVASASSDTFALADVYKMDEVIPERFADNASWLAHRATYSAIRQAGGANLDDFWVGLRDGRPSSMLGHPPYPASAMDSSVTATAENYLMVLGDFRWFWIIDRLGFSMELIPHLFSTTTNRPSGQRGVFAYWRNGSDIVLKRAFRMLNVT